MAMTIATPKSTRAALIADEQQQHDPSTPADSTMTREENLHTSRELPTVAQMEWTVALALVLCFTSYSP
jgi:hypothetical protein